MSMIVSVHSFRGGTGKSNTTANLSALLAMKGYRVGVVDTDINSPGIHVIFGLEPTAVKYTLNDYLWNKCEIKDAAHDVSQMLGAPVSGKVFLIPSSVKVGEISRILREGYDVSMLNEGFNRLVGELNLDFLLIDTHPGLNEETLMSIAISDALIIILRPDHQDYQGTSVTVEVARKLEVPRLLLVINKVPTLFNTADVQARVEKTYNCEVAAVLPHSDEMMILASSGIFSVRYPDHPLTELYKQITQKLMR